MNYPFLVIAAVSIFSMACKEQKPSPKAETTAARPADTLSAPQPYFPIYDFLSEEISYVDSLPVGIMKYRSRGTRTDSGYIRLPEFHKLANEFLTAELKDSFFAKQFTETSFFDKSSNNATFFYVANNDSNLIRRVDVVTAKGDIYDEVKSIYIQKNRTIGDDSKMMKLIWKPRRNFQIISLDLAAAGEPKSDLIKVVWDNRE